MLTLNYKYKSNYAYMLLICEVNHLQSRSLGQNIEGFKCFIFEFLPNPEVGSMPSVFETKDF